MKLKHGITKEQLEKLGFESHTSFGYSYYIYYFDECSELEIMKDGVITLVGFSSFDALPNIILKMFELGYIEESERGKCDE